MRYEVNFGNIKSCIKKNSRMNSDSSQTDLFSSQKEFPLNNIIEQMISYITISDIEKVLRIK